MFCVIGFRLFAIFSMLFFSNLFYKKEIHRGLTGDIIEDLSMAVGLRYKDFHQKEWAELCKEIIDEKKTMPAQSMIELIPIFERDLELYFNGIIGIQKLREEVGIVGRKWFFKATELSRALHKLTFDLKTEEVVADHPSKIRLSERIKSYIGIARYKEFLCAITMLMISTKKINNYFGKHVTEDADSMKFPDENKTLASVFRHKILFFTFASEIDLQQYCTKNYVENKKLFLDEIAQFYKQLVIDLNTSGYINSSHILTQYRWQIFRHFVLMLLFQAIQNSVHFEYDRIDDDDPLELVFEFLSSTPESIIESDLGGIDSHDTANKFFLTKDLLDFFIENTLTDNPIFEQEWFKQLHIIRNIFPELRPTVYRNTKKQTALKSKNLLNL